MLDIRGCSGLQILAKLDSKGMSAKKQTKKTRKLEIILSDGTEIICVLPFRRL